MKDYKRKVKISNIAALTEKLKNSIGMTDDNVFNKIKTVTLDDLSRRLNELHSLIGDEELKIAFIGPVGVGKTAIICDLLGLRREIKTKNGYEYKNVLTTSAGRTTACEVEINISKNLFIECIPMNEDDQEQVVYEYSLSIWKQAGGEIIGEYDSPSSEIQRLVGNIIGLNNEQAIQICKKYLEHESEGFDEFYGNISGKFDAVDKNETHLTFDAKAGEELEWIAKNFGDINLGKAKGFPIPKKLIINIPRHIARIPSGLNIKSLLDTKGLDSAGIPREDIDSIIKSGEYICLFIDRFGDVPNSCSSILARHITAESKDIEYRCAILVNSRIGEVDSTMNDDGEYVSDEEAYSIKRRQITSNLHSAGVKRFVNENIIFFDPYANFSMKREVLTLHNTKDMSEVSKNTESLWLSIIGVFTNLLSYYDSEIENLKKRYESIALSKTLDITDKNLIQSADEELNIILSKGLRTSNYFRFYASLASLHVSTFRAVNNRYGDYNGNSIYHMFGEASKEAFRTFTQENKDDIARSISELRVNCKSEELKVCLEQYLDKLNADFEKLCEAAALTGKAYITSEVHPNHTNFSAQTEEFWRAVIGRWGQGPGYRDDVISIYRHRLESFSKFSVESFNQIWGENMVSPYRKLLSN